MKTAQRSDSARRRAALCRAFALGLLLGLLNTAGAASAAPSRAERAAMEGLGGRLSGRIVWESNRTGHWELYVMNADGSNARQLTHLAGPGSKRLYESYLRPRISPDGMTVLFGYGKGGAPCEVWTASMADGTAAKRTVGTPLNWSPDGTLIYFVRDSKLWSYDPAAGKESQVYGTKLPVDGRGGDMVGTVAPDLKSAVFRTPRRNEFVTLPDGKFVRTMGGCEPRFSADGRFVYWVNGPRDFRRWEIKANKETPLLGKPPVSPYNYTYFPTVSTDARWLLYGASPGQHSHTTSDYEVYMQELKDWQPSGPPVRLTFDRRTDRWPHLWVAAERPGTPARLAVTKAPPGDFPVFTFAAADAGPEFGDQWGLWPQQPQCRGIATVLPGQDAEGGNGGAMQIEYDIRGAPRSFSLWMELDNRAVDFSEHDRFVIFAKGTVPSLTLVVKDGNATEGDAPDGIADCPIRGLTAEWQRFDALFSRFIPRRKGAKVDWSTIKHVGIALIGPGDHPQGTICVDNLRVSAGATTPSSVAKAAGPAVPGRIVHLALADIPKPVVGNSEPQGPELALQPGETRFLRCRPGGVALTGPTILASGNPASAVSRACARAGELTLTAWVKPQRLDQTGPARIFTISADPGQRNLTLGQEGSRYIVRLRTTERSNNGIPSLDAPPGVVTTAWTHVAYTRDRAGNATVYVDGKVVAHAVIPGSLSNWDEGYRMAVGNELTGDRPWLGEVRCISLFDRALTGGDVLEDLRRDAPEQVAQTDDAPAYDTGWIVWESNRTGSWQLYKTDLQGKNQRQLTSGAGDFTQAAARTDGTRILYTRTLRGKPPEVWIMTADGTDARRLIENASDPHWRKHDTAVHFLRQPDRGKKQWQTWSLDLATGKQACIFPVEGVTYKPEIWAAEADDSGTHFVAWSPRPRGTWVLSADGKVQTHVHGGCEGQVAPDQRYGFGVKTAGQFVRFNLSDGGAMIPVLTCKGPWSHTYFPCISPDRHWLVYGACPPDQHNHDTSDYEIFLVRLVDWTATGEPRRLTFNKKTDRWPAIFVPPASGPSKGDTARHSETPGKQG